MCIRRAGEEDIDSIVSLINESNREAYEDIIPSKLFEDPILDRDEVEDMFRWMEFYVYESGGNIVGVAGLNVSDEKVGKVRWVHVLPGYRREGIGTALMRHLENTARKKGLDKLVVYYVHEDADWAHEFYRKLGYDKEGEISHRMGRCYLFVKRIK
ncbi:MAG: GNAT family N-acetyltransferase [Candidatus Hadarchaeia archaeon]